MHEAVRAEVDPALGHDLQNVGVEAELRPLAQPFPGERVQPHGAPDGDVANDRNDLVLVPVAPLAEQAPEDHVINPC
jgi:hypothetical protein